MNNYTENQPDHPTSAIDRMQVDPRSKRSLTTETKPKQSKICGMDITPILDMVLISRWYEISDNV